MVSETSSDGSLNQNDLDKLLHYYGLGVPLAGEVYCLLRGRPLSQMERERLTYLGAATGLFDDLFDKKEVPTAHIKQLMENLNVSTANSAFEKLLVKMFLAAGQEGYLSKLKPHTLKIFEAQVSSKKQKEEPAPSIGEILSITEEKGKHSLLFYRAALDDEVSVGEEALLSQIALIGQLENDIFDIYKDYKEGIATLATIERSMTNLKAWYLKLLNQVGDLVGRLDYQKNNKVRFMIFFHILASRALVCLDQLISLETDQKFEIKKYSRKELICDMESPKNLWLWVSYYLDWHSYYAGFR